MFGTLREFFRRWYADRVLLSSAPRLPAAQRRLAWAATNASQEARHEWQARANQYALMGGGGRVPVPLELARAQGIWTPELLAGVPQPDRRSTNYPVFAGLGHGRHPGLRRLPKPAPFNLRRFSETPPARRAINKIKNSILRLDWEVVPRDEKFRRSQGSAQASDPVPLDMQQRIDAITRAMRFPNEDDTFLEVMGQVLEDILIGGFGSLEVQPWDGNELQPFRSWPVDGMSVRINMDWERDDHPNPDRAYRYSQALAYGGAAVTTHEKVEFLDRELMYVRYDPRTNTPFGLGPTEVAFQMINAWLGHFDARERMESNDVPPFGLQLGEDASKEDVSFFRTYWQNEIEGMGKIPIMGGMKAPEVLMFRMRQMGQAVNAWPEIVLRMIAISYHLAPQTFGLERDVNRNTSEVQQSEEFADAVLPVVKVLEDGITQHCIWKVCGWDDLELKFKTTVSDQEKAVAGAVALFNADIITRNEAREKVDVEPMPPDDPRGGMFLTDIRGAAAPPGGGGGPPMGLGHSEAAMPENPAERLQLEEQLAAPGLRPAAPVSPMHAMPLTGAFGSLMSAAEVIHGELRAAAAEQRTARVGVVLEDEETFNAVARILATHRNGHA